MKEASRKESNVFISPVNWYVAGIMLRFEVIGEKLNNPNKRCIAWENHHLINAKNPHEAYEKAVKIGKESESSYENPDGKNLRWIFEGLTTLVPVFEELEDGAEIVWIEHENKAVKTIKKWVKPKENLEVFQKS